MNKFLKKSFTILLATTTVFVSTATFVPSEVFAEGGEQVSSPSESESTSSVSSDKEEVKETTESSEQEGGDESGKKIPEITPPEFIYRIDKNPIEVDPETFFTGITKGTITRDYLGYAHGVKKDNKDSAPYFKPSKVTVTNSIVKLGKRTLTKDSVLRLTFNKYEKYDGKEDGSLKTSSRILNLPNGPTLIWGGFFNFDLNNPDYDFGGYRGMGVYVNDPKDGSSQVVDFTDIEAPRQMDDTWVTTNYEVNKSNYIYKYSDPSSKQLEPTFETENTQKMEESEIAKPQPEGPMQPKPLSETFIETNTPRELWLNKTIEVEIPVGKYMDNSEGKVEREIVERFYVDEGPSTQSGMRFKPGDNAYYEVSLGKISFENQHFEPKVAPAVVVGGSIGTILWGYGNVVGDTISILSGEKVIQTTEIKQKNGFWITNIPQEDMPEDVTSIKVVESGDIEYSMDGDSKELLQKFFTPNQLVASKMKEEITKEKYGDILYKQLLSNSNKDYVNNFVTAILAEPTVQESQQKITDALETVGISSMENGKYIIPEGFVVADFKEALEKSYLDYTNVLKTEVNRRAAVLRRFVEDGGEMKNYNPLENTHSIFSMLAYHYGGTVENSFYNGGFDKETGELFQGVEEYKEGVLPITEDATFETRLSVEELSKEEQEKGNKPKHIPPHLKKWQLNFEGTHPFSYISNYTSIYYCIKGLKDEPNPEWIEQKVKVETTSSRVTFIFVDGEGNPQEIVLPEDDKEREKMTILFRATLDLSNVKENQEIKYTSNVITGFVDLKEIEGEFDEEYDGVSLKSSEETVTIRPAIFNASWSSQSMIDLNSVAINLTDDIMSDLQIPPMYVKDDFPDMDDKNNAKYSIAIQKQDGLIVKTYPLTVPKREDGQYTLETPLFSDKSTNETFKRFKGDWISQLKGGYDFATILIKNEKSGKVVKLKLDFRTAGIMLTSVSNLYWTNRGTIESLGMMKRDTGNDLVIKVEDGSGIKEPYNITATVNYEKWSKDNNNKKKLPEKLATFYWQDQETDIKPLLDEEGNPETLITGKGSNTYVYKSNPLGRKYSDGINLKAPLLKTGEYEATITWTLTTVGNENFR